jgi:hypothetical protein
MPTINTKLASPFVILGALVVLSYFTKDGWWTWAGLSILIAYIFGEAEFRDHNSFAYLFSFIALVLFVFGIFAMGWNYF